LEKPIEDYVAERDKHDASCVAHSTRGLYLLRPARKGTEI
jgi:hypothetical protein